ncbi:MAG TPA: protoporphyrinogen oxidase [Candidatus Omnitrophica bacterium]|nr:protoporphyrinogen oxidase [Candidatus Omnitrophota bacterium]
MAKKKRIIIVGAGLSGLSAAWHLQKRGIECLVFEKEPEVGGLCRSKKINGFTFDYAGHLLHFRHRYAFNLVKRLLSDNLHPYKRSAWVYSHERYIPSPFQANLFGLPPKVVKDCLMGFIQAHHNKRFLKKRNMSFHDWIYDTFGKGIAAHFMVPYNRKFWTVPLTELTCEWLNGFIPLPSLAEVVEGAVQKTKKDGWGYNSRFWYPEKGGIASLPLALARQIRNIYTHCEIVEVNSKEKEIRMKSGSKEKFDCLISTIPLPEFGCLFKSLPQSIHSLLHKLKWNSIFNLNLGLQKRKNAHCHWVYFPQKEINFFRIGFPSCFSPYTVPSRGSSLYAEVAYSKDQPIDKSSIVSSIKKDLQKIGIIGGEGDVCAQDVNDIRYGYPIYDKNYRGARKGIVRFLLQKQIIPCGRFGSWRYMSMEDVLLNGMELAKSIAHY